MKKTMKLFLLAVQLGAVVLWAAVATAQPLIGVRPDTATPFTYTDIWTQTTDSGVSVGFNPYVTVGAGAGSATDVSPYGITYHSQSAIGVMGLNGMVIVPSWLNKTHEITYVTEISEQVVYENGNMVAFHQGDTPSVKVTWYLHDLKYGQHRPDVVDRYGNDGGAVKLMEATLNLLNASFTASSSTTGNGSYDIKWVITWSDPNLIDLIQHGSSAIIDGAKFTGTIVRPPQYNPTKMWDGTTTVGNLTFKVDGSISFTQSNCTGSIGDFVWQDANRNGQQDAGEPGIDGATVNLLKSSDSSLIATMTTGSAPLYQHGYYQFNGLCAGDYKVEVIPPPGYFPTSPCSSDQTTGTDSNCSPAEVSLSTNTSSNQTIDFGFVTPCTGAIGDFVWNDIDRNGQQDAGEPGIDGVTVNLLKAGVISATTTTGIVPGGVHGSYQFSGLCQGDYQVQVIFPTGFSPTLPCSINQTIGSDSNCSPAPVNLPDDNFSNQTIDFGFVTPCTGTIGDYVWLDKNYNSLQDADETGIDGVTITLLKPSDSSFKATTTTGVDPNGIYHGYYEFSGLCKGGYTVVSDPPAGLNPVPLCSDNQTIGDDSNCPPVPVSLFDDNSSNQTIDFGFESPCSGKMGDFVWEDLNGNGLQDVGEPGIDGVTVHLRKSDNTMIATTTTSVDPGGKDGYYQFDGICTGDYIVEVVIPVGYLYTKPCGNDQSIPNDSNCNPALVKLPWNDSSNQTIDFGFVKAIPKVTIVKYTNGADANDPNAAGVPNIAAGGTVTWTYKVTNTGNVSVPKAQVVVTDNQTGVTPAYDSELSGNGDASFDPGEVLQYEATGTAVNLVAPPAGVKVVPAVCTAGGTQPPRTAYTNIGTVTIPGASATDPSSYCNPPAPAVTIIKYTNGADANDPNAAGVPNIAAGGTVTWTYKVTNTGNVPVPKAQVVVTDNQTGVTPTYDSELSGNGDASFDPGEVWQYKATGTAVNLVAPPAGVKVVPAVCTAGGTQSPRTAYTNTGTVTIPGASATDPSSYCNPPCQGTVGDFVWYDANLNGIQDTGELGASGVTVYLLNATGSTILDTRVTDADGKYQFSSLACGSYKVMIGVPSGYMLTTTNVPGSTTENDSNPNPSIVSLSGGQDLSVDFGLVHGQHLCGNCPTDAGMLLWGIDTTNNKVYVRYDQSYDANDNSYGVNTVGWPAGTTHKFSDLTGSDKAEFIFKNSAGTTVLDFYLDYITAKSGNPSGYASLGPFGGDGSWVSGTQGYLLSWNTSLAKNLNGTGYCVGGNCTVQGLNLLVNSPPTASSTSFVLTDPAHFGKWNFVDSYEMVVNGAAFGGAANFGTVRVGLVHDSPKKLCTDNAVTPAVCPPPASLALRCAAGTGAIGQVYSSSLVASGGTSPYTYSIVSGSLPPGLTLNPNTGTITGISTSYGTFSYTAKAVDMSGNPVTGLVTSDCSINVACTALGSCTPSYPFSSANPLTNIAFNESEVLRAYQVQVDSPCSPKYVKLFYNDEHAMTLGIRQVNVVTKSGKATITTPTNYTVTPLGSNPGSATNPSVGSTVAGGDQAGVDVSGRPIFPSMYITDITGNSGSLAGDWQYAGGDKAIPPQAVFGTWKAAVRTVNKTVTPNVVTVTPDTDPAKNNWNLGAGSDPVPAGLVNEGYGAEARWDISMLGLLSGHTYRLYFIVHDGDQNKAGGDCGQGCSTIYIP